MDNEEILKERDYWYSQTFILFEIIKCLNHRELCMINKDSKLRNQTVRFLKSYSIEFFKKHYEKLGIGKKLVNLYHGVAILREFPMFSYNLRERRKKEEYIEFNENFKNYVEGYDLFFDFDGKENFDLCYKESGEFKLILENDKIPYYILNSSSKGFHFVIPFEFFSKEKDIQILIEKLRNVSNNIKGIYSFSCLDNSIYDIKRVKKLPYSYVCDGTIALPLTDDQFNKFSPEIVRMNHVLKNNKIKERGLLIRTYGLSNKELISNTTKFLKNYQE